MLLHIGCLDWEIWGLFLMERGAGTKRRVPEKKEQSWKDRLEERPQKCVQILEIREMHKDECQGMPQDPGW